MVLGSFAETKEPRLPGRNPAIQPMPHFFYHGLTRQGALQQGQLTANSSQEAVRVLRQRHLAVTHIRETHPLFSWDFTWSWGLGVRPRDVLAFTLQFGTMVKAGIPLISCLELDYFV